MQARSNTLRPGGSQEPGMTGVANRPDEPGRGVGRGSTTVTLPSLADSGHTTFNQHELSEELAGMAASVAEVDPRSADRLRHLSRAIVSEEGRRRWAGIDLRRAFNTERLANAYATRREGGMVSPMVDWADRIRNILVLIPIFLTWFALAEAARGYDSYLAKHPDQVRSPFLLLWQRGFGGDSGFFTPTFSTVAIIDAIIIFIIISLTVYAHGRREAREDAIALTAANFQVDLDNALAETAVILATDTTSRPELLAESVERLADRFERGSQELLTRLRVEHDRLEAVASRREREFADFGVFASGMRAGAEETRRLLIELGRVSSGLQNALEDLTSEVGVTGDQQRTLLTAVQGLERLVSTGIQSDQAVLHQLAEAASSLAEASDRTMANAEAAAQAGRVASEAVRGIADMTEQLASGQSRVEDAIASGAEANARLAESLRGSTGGVASTVQSLAGIGSELAQLRQEFTRLGDRSAEQAAALNSLLNDQHAIANEISKVARDLSAVGITTAQRQREVNEDISLLLNRLDGLTDALSHVATGAPLGESVRREPAYRPPEPSPDLPENRDTGYRRERSLWPQRDRRQ